MTPPGDPARATIRRTTEADLPRLEWSGAFAHHRQIIREAFAAQGRGEAVMLVADLDGFPVGQAWLELTPKADSAAPAVWAVRVMEPLQGKGLGARLMAAMEAEARALGCAELELAVEKANPRARRLYERLGWRVRRERREAYAYVTPEGASVSQALDEWVLGKRLSPSSADSPTRA